MVANISKNTAIESTVSKSNAVLWADATATWGSSVYLWAEQGVLPVNISKNTATVNNIMKS